MRVELDQVTRRFGPIAALRDVTLQLPAGARTALIGPNGAGKSTLTRVIMGLLRSAGTVTLDGRCPFEHRASLAHRLAYVPQVAPQLGSTVRELVRTVACLRAIPIDRFGELAARLGLDLAAVQRRPLRALSGGMRQKLLLAIALAARDAELLILDEPTASLDAASREQFFALMAELPAATSILLSSHRLEEIRHLVDRVLVLEDGAVRYDGEATAYLRQAGLGVLEVMARAPRATQWLAANGFRQGAAGWWTHALRNGERVELVREVLTELQGEIGDLVVRDAEHLVVQPRESAS